MNSELHTTPSAKPSGANGTRTSAASPLIGAASVALRHRKLILFCTMGLAAVVVGMTLIKPRTYTSAASFIPQTSGGSMAALSSVAAQFGVNVGKEDPTQSPDFYSEVLKSRGILTNVAARSYTVRTPEGMRTGDLASVLDLPQRRGAMRLDAALRALDRSIFARITRQTGIVHISVRTPYLDLSEQIATHVLAELEEFNSQLRQNRASAEEEFLGQREEEARTANSQAQARLVAFLQRNRHWESSPSLAYEHSRLLQEASYRNDVMINLAQARAQARIEALRNTPVIAVVDRPSRPVRPDGRGLTLRGILAVTFGLLLGFVLALLIDAFRRPEEEDLTEQFVRLRGEAAKDLRNPLRLLVPSRSAGSKRVELS